MTIAPVTREGPRDCPHCEEMTMANRMPDGSLVCSCPAMRPLPGGLCLEGPSAPRRQNPPSGERQ
jgi:hypothetical protein